MVDMPIIGEMWQLKPSEGDPWPQTDVIPPVRILDVLQGWVRYYQNNIFPDQRMPLRMFISNFGKVNGEITDGKSKEAQGEQK